MDKSFFENIENEMPAGEAGINSTENEVCEPVLENAETVERESLSSQEVVYDYDAKDTEDEMQSENVREEVWRHEPDSPYSPLYVPEQKNKNTLTIIVIFVLILFLIGGMIMAVSKLVESAMKGVSAEMPAWKESYEEWKDRLEEEFAEEPGKKEDGWSEDSDDVFTFEWEDDYEEFEEAPYDEYFGEDYSEYEEYEPSESDEYYVQLADSIRDDLSYSVEKQEYTYSDADMGVDIYVEYASVDGLAFDDKINKALEENAMYYARELGSDDVMDFYLFVESYVTYMDEDILSVVVSEQYVYDYEVGADLYCMNFDLHTGVLLYNTEIISPSEELAEAFVKMSEYQNGYIEYVDEISNQDVERLFSNEETLILFYTPVGLEVGFNYPDGWVTATIKDYEKYLNKL